MTPQDAAERATAAVRELNHMTLPGVAGLDVTNVYDVIAELALLAVRLPQAFAQIEAILDDLIERHQVVIVDGDQAGDPVATAVVAGHWLGVARDAIEYAAHALDHAQQALTWAATPNPLGK